MEIERTKNSIDSIIWGSINKFVGIFGPFITRTVIIYILGDEYSGLNSVFFSILNVLNLAELGFGNAIVYSMYKPIAENDVEKISALMNMYRKIYKYLGIFIGVLGIIFVPYVKYFVSKEIPGDISLEIVYLIYLGNTVVSYLLFGYKNSVLNAYQRFDIVSNIATIINMAMYLIQIIILCVIKNYYAYICIMLLATVCNNIVTAYVVKNKFPEYVPVGDISSDEKKVYIIM